MATTYNQHRDKHINHLIALYAKAHLDLIAGYTHITDSDYYPLPGEYTWTEVAYNPVSGKIERNTIYPSESEDRAWVSPPLSPLE